MPSTPGAGAAARRVRPLPARTSAQELGLPGQAGPALARLGGPGPSSARPPARILAWTWRRWTHRRVDAALAPCVGECYRSSMEFVEARTPNGPVEV